MPGNAESSNSDLDHGKKWLIRVLIIVGIGVPVIIELTTFSGMVTSQLFSDQNTGAEKSVQSTGIASLNHINTGDTLFTRFKYPIKIDHMYLRVQPDRWDFLLQLTALDVQKNEQINLNLRVNRLYTGNRSIDDPMQIQWKAGDRGPRTINYELKAGEQPEKISLSLFIISNKDTLDRRSVKYELGHVPARYAR